MHGSCCVAVPILAVGMGSVLGRGWRAGSMEGNMRSRGWKRDSSPVQCIAQKSEAVPVPEEIPATTWGKGEGTVQVLPLAAAQVQRVQASKHQRGSVAIGGTISVSVEGPSVAGVSAHVERVA